MNACTSINILLLIFAIILIVVNAWFFRRFIKFRKAIRDYLEIMAIANEND